MSDVDAQHYALHVKITYDLCASFAEHAESECTRVIIESLARQALVAGRKPVSGMKLLAAQSALGVSFIACRKANEPTSEDISDYMLTIQAASAAAALCQRLSFTMREEYRSLYSVDEIIAFSSDLSDFTDLALLTAGLKLSRMHVEQYRDVFGEESFDDGTNIDELLQDQMMYQSSQPSQQSNNEIKKSKEPPVEEKVASTPPRDEVSNDVGDSDGESNHDVGDDLADDSNEDDRDDSSKNEELKVSADDQPDQDVEDQDYQNFDDEYDPTEEYENDYSDDFGDEDDEDLKEQDELDGYSDGSSNDSADDGQGSEDDGSDDSAGRDSGRVAGPEPRQVVTVNVNKGLIPKRSKQRQTYNA